MQTYNKKTNPQIKYVDSYLRPGWPESFGIEYEYEGKDKSLLMDATRFIDLAFKTNLIDDYEETLIGKSHVMDLDNSFVYFDAIEDPSSPEECDYKPYTYEARVSFRDFWDMLSVSDKMKLVKHTEFQLAQQNLLNRKITFGEFAKEVESVNF